MMKINELRKVIFNHIGNNDFEVRKYTMKHDGKKGYFIVIHGYGENNKRLPLYLKEKRVHLLSDMVNKKRDWRGAKDLGFRTYEILY